MARKKPKQPSSPPASADGSLKKAKRTMIQLDDDLVHKVLVLAALERLKMTPWINNQIRRLISERWRPEFEIQKDNE